MSYIPLSKTTHIPHADFYKVAAYGSSEVFGAECPKSKESAGIGDEPKIASVKSVDVQPTTCRDSMRGKMFLCDYCTSHYRDAKKAMGADDVTDDCVYIAEDEATVLSSLKDRAPSSLKDRAVNWVKEHPYLALSVGAVSAVGLIGIIAGFVSYSSAGVSAPVKGEVFNATTASTTTEPFASASASSAVPIKQSTADRSSTTEPLEPTTFSNTQPATTPALQTTAQTESTEMTTQAPVPTEAKTTEATTQPATTSVTTAKPEKTLVLSLEINNAQTKQALRLTTKQLFKNFSLVERHHKVLENANTTLTFDINNKHHKQVRITYSNNFDPGLKKSENCRVDAPSTYVFGEAYARLNASGEYIADENQDGKLVASHSLYRSGGYYVIDRQVEDASGQARPSVLLRDMRLYMHSQNTSPIKFGYEVQGCNPDGGYMLDFSVQPNQVKSLNFTVGVIRLRAQIEYKSRHYGLRVYDAKQFPIDANGNMCIRSTGDLHLTNLTQGRCRS